MIKSPSKFLSIPFLKALQANNYLSATGTEYCAEETDRLLLEKCTDSPGKPTDWAGIFTGNKTVCPPEFWTIARRLDPKFITIH